MILSILFWISVFIIFYSYILFPFILQLLSANKKDNQVIYHRNGYLPHISVLISVYNEEKVIIQKIESIYNSGYPPENFEVVVGSDASTDSTNDILEMMAEKYQHFRFFISKMRKGKGNILNKLYAEASGDILVITDANVMFDRDTLYELAKHFRNEKIGLVDTNMINIGMKKSGISIQEKSYISREVKIKNMESRIWRTMMGPFGGCYAVRKEYFRKIPANFMVDDFYVNMNVLAMKQQAINNLDAKVYEDVSNNLSVEFRRKVRIATGNFQNLRAFYKMLWSPTKGLGFCFLSHKVLRWTGPLFLISALVFNILLAFESRFYYNLLFFHLFLFILPLTDLLFRKIKIHIVPLRFVTHFYAMNLALLTGFFKSLKGVKSNVWKPTERNQ